MIRVDVAVVGGGVVGAACALALAREGLEVVLVEAAEPPRWSADAPDLRVYAMAPDSVALLDALGVWPSVASARAQPIRHMRVWDAAGGGTLPFDADGLARNALGWITEHGLLVDRLWQALHRAGIRVESPARVDAMAQDEQSVRLSLDDGGMVQARLAIAADGGNSALRELAGIETKTKEYAQRGLVAYVRSERPHDATAWQRFLPGGPLALLPCAGGRSSIVWTLPEDEVAGMTTVDASEFDRRLTRASDRCLGALAVDSPRVAFPLRRLLAQTQVAGRVLVIGDAAHVVHPLAGQGVNLGLRDVAALQATLAAARANGGPFDSPSRLRRWARMRRSDNTVSAVAFEAINRAYSGDAPLPMLLRGHALGLAGRFAPLRHALWRHAAGG